MLLYKLTRFQLKAGGSRCCHEVHVEKNYKVNAFHCKSILSGSLLVVGSFFENLAIIKMSVAGRWFCGCLPTAQACLLWQFSFLGLCTEQGRERTGTLKGGRGQWRLTEAWACNTGVCLPALKAFSLCLHFCSSIDAWQVYRPSPDSCSASLGLVSADHTFEEALVSILMMPNQEGGRRWWGKTSKPPACSLVRRVTQKPAFLLRFCVVVDNRRW